MVRPALCFASLFVLAVSATATTAQQSAAITHPPTPAEQPTQTACTEGVIVISSPAEGDRQLACSGARQAVELLGRCGVSLHRPLRLEIAEQIAHPFGRPVLGFFDVTEEKVLIRSSQSVADIVRHTPFAAVPSRRFYMSLVAHEVVHGILHQNAERHMMSHTAGEYLAYALQIESLPPNERRALLLSFPNSGSTDDLLFSDLMLSLDPFLFAARAYGHFSADQDRCRLVKALLDGEVSFIAATY